MNVVTRFPPSPTGFMHIGTARTALFNWLYARKYGGEMKFRIEDTDRARHNEEAVVALINATEWLGLDWDGDIVSQHAQQERHAEIARALLEAGKAWRCYYTAEELEKLRADAGGFKLPRYTDILKMEESGQLAPSQKDTYTIRIIAPHEGQTEVQDLVQGQVTVQNSELDDFVLLRSDGSPTYMLAVVVDDHDMGVTHVIRGDDHLNNTFRQNVIYDAMGWEKPTYAHLPLILGPDGKKMSKRHGAASVEEYREMGYLPEALRNYLLRLGWSHGDDEIISDGQALEWFDLTGCNKAAGRFDFAKLESLNSHYIQIKDIDALIDYALPFYQKRHNVTPDEKARTQIKACGDELKSRAKTILQFIDESVFFAKTIPLKFDDKAASIIAENQEILRSLLDILEKSQEDHGSDDVQAMCKKIADQMTEGKLGKVAMPLRAAVTGTTVSPSIFHVCAILGKEETCARIRAALGS